METLGNRGPRRWLCLSLILLCADVLAAGPLPEIQFVGDAEKEGGFLLEITKEACRRAGYTARFTAMPVARALQEVFNGDSEAIVGIQYTAERAEKLGYSELLGSSEMVFFSKLPPPAAYRSLSDLRGLTIGTISGAAYTDEFDRTAALRKEPAPDVDTNIKKLIAGRIDLFLEKKTVVLDLLRDRYPDQRGSMIALEPPLKVMQFYNAFSKKAAGWEKKREAFNRGLRLITGDGTLQRILDRGLHE